MKNNKIIPAILLVLAFGFMLPSAQANPFIFKHDQSNNYLKIELLKDRGLHFELLQFRPAQDRIWISPMLVKESIGLDNGFQQTGNTLSNSTYKVTVDTKTLCVTVLDKSQEWNLGDFCPLNINATWKGLTVNSPEIKNFYGLGQYFTNPGNADGDLAGRVWDPMANGHGNALRAFSKGANSYAMFPVLYSLGSGNRNFMFFYDSTYKQMWSLNQSPWKVESYGDQVRWFIYTAEDVRRLKRQYMNITGHAPVPPKDVFGLWVSEFGFDNWKEIDRVIADLRHKNFPVDGFALDIQWFGGDFYQGNVDRSGSRFGTLEFDSKRFPRAEAKVREFKEEEGVELMPIEESYISKFLPEHKDLAAGGHMAKWCGTDFATELTSNPWWGIGGMIDWTSPKAGDFWHDQKRAALVSMGITHHWTDLGEPEMYDDNSCYWGYPELGKHKHADIHNIYNFRWLESIARGYERNGNKERPFMMSRSGTAGLHRFGSAMWSGDIGANMDAMTAHYNAQMHMFFSGVDYYGADVGGFHRRSDTLDGDPDVLYTQWFANAALFDFPIRAHTWNLANNLHPSPARIGHTSSNKANLYLRYKLFPYYYSLAHNGWLTGDGIVRPMVMEFPTDLQVRKTGNQKMIGPYLMAGMVANYHETERNLYLPKGTWINYYTGEFQRSSGGEIRDLPAYQNDTFRIPLFVKAGAIVPTMLVDEQTMNISGKRKDGKTSDDFGLLVAPDRQTTEFVVYEDDGKSIEYKSGEVAATTVTLKQSADGEQVELVIMPARGRYQGMLDQRNYSVELLLENRTVASATLSGKTLSKCAAGVKNNCFAPAGYNRTTLYLGRHSIDAQKLLLVHLEKSGKESSLFFKCQNAFTQTGESYYVVGDVEQLGNGDVSKALKLNPSAYPTWTAYLTGLPTARTIKWKCIKKPEAGDLARVLYSSKEQTARTADEGYAGKTNIQL
ncbi:MAG TPA: glycoside hydrolase family 31 [Bdellovibrionales bacterium]|nr:glycoside hydrolase family 31 [Bdellovibrionales bacterium]